MPSNRTAFVIAALMCAASVSAVVVRPTVKVGDEVPSFSLETMIPKQFGDWREETLRNLQVVNPQTQEFLDRLYSQILTRTYVNGDGYRIMLSLAYGSEQRGSLQVHKPEVCYPAQGFVLQKNETGLLVTAFGEIPVRRLFTTMGPRQEPVTYWITLGDSVVLGWAQQKLAVLRYGLTGHIPDGMLFRVSSIDPNQTRANQMQDNFVNQLLDAMAPAERKRLIGLGEQR